MGDKVAALIRDTLAEVERERVRLVADGPHSRSPRQAALVATKLQEALLWWEFGDEAERRSQR